MADSGGGGDQSREELLQELHQTREQLSTAAEMGGALMVELQQLELLKQEHARLEEAKEESDQAREELEWRVEELETSQQQLQALLKERDAEQGGAPKIGRRCHSALPSAAIRREAP